MNQLQIKSLFNVAEVEISYHNNVPYQDRIQLIQSSTVYEVLRQAWDANKIELVEQFNILLVDNKNNCLGISTVATGSINACIVDTRIVFSTALKAKASGIILSHNHPSGNLQPSEPDKKLTEKFVEGGKILDIAILDHLIVSKEGYYSFADNGLVIR